MKVSKRVLWFSFASFCCAGLLLTAGELSKIGEAKAAGVKSDGPPPPPPMLVTYCPIKFYFQYEGVYYYAVSQSGTGCLVTGYMGASRPHDVGCPDCTDPITTTGHPLPFPKFDDASESGPRPDPMFSGVLR